MQLITSNNFHKTYPKLKISNYWNFDEFDNYEYNFIDLNQKEIFLFSNCDLIFNHSLLNRLLNAINKSNNSQIIVLLPQDLFFKKTYLADHIDNLIWQLAQYFNIYIDLTFGSSKTFLNESFFVDSDFSIDFNKKYNIITKNNNGNVTSFKNNKIIFTTLNLFRNGKYKQFVKKISNKKVKNIMPDWFRDMEYFDDVEQKNFIMSNLNKIKKLEEEIEQSKKKLKENNRYKSILYTQSDELVSVVFKILEQLLNINLQDFEDKFNEDFLIELDDVSFIGEIKGVKDNLKSSHLRQLNDYYEDREELELDKNIKPILIINTFRFKMPSERTAIYEKQIEKAKSKYGILIITTPVLLELYEMFLNKEITTNEIIERFKNEVGLFEI